jgi:Tol biopolymer transport system component
MNMPSRIAAAAVVGVLAVGGALYLSRPGQVAVTPPSPSAAASSSPHRAVVVSPSPSVDRPMPSSSSGPCVTDQVAVLTGDAVAGSQGDRLAGPARGTYLAGRAPTLWAVGPDQASATVIARVTPELDVFNIVDLSPDGSDVLIRVGNISPPGFTPECADLYVVPTDGSAATRLTTFGPRQFVAGAAFSPDGGRVAYSWWDPGTLTVLDLASGATVHQACAVAYSGSTARVDWSPTGDRVAAVCQHTLTVFDAAGATAPARFPTTEAPVAFTWTDDQHLVVASGGGSLYSFDAVAQTSTLLGSYADPQIEIVSESGVFSPDGRWLAYAGGERGDVPGPDFRFVSYLVPASGGIPIRVPDEVQDTFTWSGDSRALVYVTDRAEKQNTRLILARIEADNLSRSTIATIADESVGFNYRGGIWRIP